MSPTAPKRVLLDTNIVLWAVSEPSKLGALRSVIEDSAVVRVISAVVVWEVAIKAGLGRLNLTMSTSVWTERVYDDLVAERLAITEVHAAAVGDLPMHHRDPFDRLLIAQAQILGVPLATADAAMGRYDVEVLGT